MTRDKQEDVEENAHFVSEGRSSLPARPIDWPLTNSSGTTSDLTPILAAVCLGPVSNRVTQRRRAQ